MNFKSAVKILTRKIIIPDVASFMGFTRTRIDRAIGKEGARHPLGAPADWRLAIVKMAKIRAKELDKLAEKLAKDDVDDN